LACNQQETRGAANPGRKPAFQRLGALEADIASLHHVRFSSSVPEIGSSALRNAVRKLFASCEILNH